MPATWGMVLAFRQNGGKWMDTTMGFTPLAGLLMGTRSGDIDPAIVPYICERENMSLQDVNNYLNKKCGLLGISGVSSDMRYVEDAAAKGKRTGSIGFRNVGTTNCEIYWRLCGRK